MSADLAKAKKLLAFQRRCEKLLYKLSSLHSRKGLGVIDENINPKFNSFINSYYIICEFLGEVIKFCDNNDVGDFNKEIWKIEANQNFDYKAFSDKFLDLLIQYQPILVKNKINLINLLLKLKYPYYEEIKAIKFV